MENEWKSKTASDIRPVKVAKSDFFMVVIWFPPRRLIIKRGINRGGGGEIKKRAYNSFMSVSALSAFTGKAVNLLLPRYVNGCREFEIT